MKAKQLIKTFPYGYKCLDNHNGNVLLSLQSKSANGYVFVKKIPLTFRFPPIDQNVMDHIQLEWGDTCTIIDWFNDDACRYFITTFTRDNLINYNLTLQAVFGDEAFDIKGFFTEKKGEKYRERIYIERYLKHVSPDAVTAKLDFTNERYDIIFPDDPLSHCRRLGEVIAMNAICSTDTHAHQRLASSHNDESLENNDEPDLK